MKREKTKAQLQVELNKLRKSQVKMEEQRSYQHSNIDVKFDQRMDVLFEIEKSLIRLIQKKDKP